MGDNFETVCRTHKDLDVWKEAVSFVTWIYTITKEFPKEEIYGLTQQIRRAAVSIPANIAEGAARNYSKEFIQFLYISLGSLSELETHLLISENLGYLLLQNKEKDELLIAIRRKLLGLIKYLRSKG